MTRPTVVYLAGTRWNDVAGTDKRLTTALAQHVDVLWVDPPFSRLTVMAGDGNGVGGVADVAPGIRRLQIRTLPGAARIGLLRHIARRQVRAHVVRVLGENGRRLLATVVASPRAEFLTGLDGSKVFYATDDWIDGASMMGLRPGRVRRSIVRNLDASDIALAVSPGTADMLHALATGDKVIEILPNGCEEVPRIPTGDPPSRRPVAGLVGQLNERLDFDALEAVARTGAEMLVVGPRTDRDSRVSDRLDRFLSSPNVEWVGARSLDELPLYLAQMSVGLTPYRDTRFNRASFPLKTLEYLAAGLPVVSTDLPAVRWLDTPFIEVSSSPDDFADRVVRILGAHPEPGAAELRIEFSRKHSWAARSRQFLSTVEAATSSPAETR